MLPTQPTRIGAYHRGHATGPRSRRLRRLAVRQGWPVHITGVELFEPRREHLEKWCDVAVFCDWREHLGALAIVEEMESWVGLDGPTGYDLAVGNPDFSLLVVDDPRESMPAVLLRHAPAVLLFHQVQSFQRGEAGARVLEAYPPAAVWRVPGSVKFRQGFKPKCPKCGGVNVTTERGRCRRPTVDVVVTSAGPDYREGPPCSGKLKAWTADSLCYQATLWLRGHEGPAQSYQLPWLPPEARRWEVPPGSETPSEDLPAAPGWAP